MLESLSSRFPNYLIEGLLIAVFMLSACIAVSIAAHPRSPVARRISRPVARRVLIGIAMGATAVWLITSPIGRRSGAHMNPAATLAFWALGKVSPVDAACYTAAQFLGAILGIALARVMLGRIITDAAVNCVATAPARHTPHAVLTAWAAEFIISFTLLMTVLILGNRASTAALTPFAVGILVALYITFEAPLSGMSMNPARTFGSAVHARSYRALWVYFTAPPLAMLSAGAVYAAVMGRDHVYCAKLDHRGDEPCIFSCRITEMR